MEVRGSRRSRRFGEKTILPRVEMINESTQEYLHKLNVAGLRAKIGIRDGPLNTRREHVEYFINTLNDREITKLQTGS